MDHLNSNLLCVIDVETTGPTPRFHDIIEICVLPLDNDLRPHGRIMPFAMNLVPMRKENIDHEALRIQRKELDTLQKHKICWDKSRLVDSTLKGCEPGRAADLFVEWFEKLKLPCYKRIMPIAHNWVFDRDFIIDWLGAQTFDMCFDPRYRDTMAMSLYDNDIAGWHIMDYPYPKNNLAYVANCLGVTHDRAHTALDDCVTTAEVFRLMVKRAIRIGGNAPEQVVEPVSSDPPTPGRDAI